MTTPDHESHGSTPAAWTGVAILTRAFIVGTLALIWGTWPLFWGGVARVGVGGIVGKVMVMMGLGKPGTGRKAKVS